MNDFGYTSETAPPPLRDAYRWLEPDPNAEYGTILPFARDKTTGETRWAMPGLVRDFLTGGLDLLAGVDTGEVTPRAAVQLGLGGLGSGASLAPRGALAAGGARLAPRLDPAALEGARRMGFNVDRPLFHGTPAPDFAAFAPVPWEAVRTGRAPGIWTAENPEVAANFSVPELRERLGLTALPGNPASRESTPRILPLFGRSENPARPLILAPGDRWGDINRTIADWFAGGHDAVQLRNYGMFPELGPQSIWGFRDPNQLRSWFARFDPSKRSSDDLLAASAVPGFNVAPPPQPGFNVQPNPQAGARITPELLPNALRRPQDREY
jgi:hypothetical protein